jgi:hypothetical protein
MHLLIYFKIVRLKKTAFYGASLIFKRAEANQPAKERATTFLSVLPSGIRLSLYRQDVYV